MYHLELTSKSYELVLINSFVILLKIQVDQTAPFSPDCDTLMNSNLKKDARQTKTSREVLEGGHREDKNS
jgi:hypothetical protein